MDQWLEVCEERLAKVVYLTPDAPRAATENHLALSVQAARDGDSFDDETSWPVPPDVRWSGCSVAAAPPAVRAHLDSFDVSSHLNPREDRLEALDFQLFTGEVSTVAYRFAGVSGHVEVQGWDGAVIENESSRRPFHRRLLLLGFGGLLTFLASLVVAGQYSARHPFLAASPNAALLWLLLLVAPWCALPVVSFFARPERRQAVLWVRTLPLLALFGLQTALASTGYPTLAAAHALVLGGEVEQALTTAAACVELGIDPAAAATLHDDLRVRQIMAVDDSGSAWQLAKEPTFTTLGRSLVDLRALQLTAAEVAAAQARGDFKTARQLLELIPKPLVDHALVRPLRLAERVRMLDGCVERLNEVCFQQGLSGARREGFASEDIRPFQERALEGVASQARGHWQVIRSRQPIEVRLRACAAIRHPMKFLDSLVVERGPGSLPRLWEIEGRCSDLRNQQRQQIARQEAAQARARERAWSLAPLLCRDGTLSPSCVCGQSSRRGCCSHHGGVAGCSR